MAMSAKKRAGKHAEENDELAAKVRAICREAVSRGYVTENQPGLTDDDEHKSPFRVLQNGVFAISFAQSVATKMGIAGDFKKSTFVLSEEKALERITATCEIARALYDRGYDKLPLNVTVEELDRNPKEAWLRLLDGLLRVVEYCDGDAASRTASSTKCASAGAVKPVQLLPVNMTAPPSGTRISPDRTKTKKGEKAPAPTPSASDNRTYAEVAKGESPPQRAGISSQIHGTPARTPQVDEGFLNSITKVFGFKTKSYTKEEFDALEKLKQDTEDKLKKCAQDLRDAKAAKQTAEQELQRTNMACTVLEEEVQAHKQLLSDHKKRLEEMQGQLKEALDQVKEHKNSMHANMTEAAEKEKRLQGRIDSLNAEISSLKEAIASKQVELHEANIAHAQQLAAQEELACTLRNEAAIVEQQHSNKLAELQDFIAAKDSEMAALTELNTTLQSQVELLNTEVETARAEMENIKADAASKLAAAEQQKLQLASRETTVAARLKHAGSALSTFKGDIAALRRDLASQFGSTIAEFSSRSKALVSMVDQARAAARDANERYVREQNERRRLHNQLQEARGNIRVFCRVRPLLSKEGDEAPVVKVISPFEVQILEAPSERNGGRISEAKTFEFDRCFSAESKQADVFEEVQPMVTSALDGFHACIFAYGQTGSGKTFTMEGIPSDRGVYFRALSSMFEQIRSRQSEYSYTLKVSMVEIYNEDVKDLLAAPIVEKEDDSSSGLEIKTGANGNYLPDATIVDIECMEDVERVMAQGALNRTVGRTNANEHSSRSHSLLMIDIYSTNIISETKSYGRLVLVDLAGSERVSKSGAEGQRLKEAQNINKSLSALGDVIAALSNKAGHIPFRNSKLTWLLADSLGKDNKTLMIVQVSPVVASRQESSCSLTFASRVRKVELGKAVKHADAGEVAKLKADLKRLQDLQKSSFVDVDKLKEQVVSAQEAEAAAKQKAAELERAMAELQRDTAATAELAKKLEAAQQALRSERELVKAEKEAAAAKDEEIDKLQKALKETQKSVKTAGKLADDASTTKVELAVKKAVEEERSRAKIEQRKSVADAESAVKSAYEKQLELLRKQLKEGVAAAEAKAKADVQTAIANAKLQWEKDLKRAATRKDRMSMAKRNHRASVAMALQEDSTTFSSTTTSVVAVDVDVIASAAEFAPNDENLMPPDVLEASTTSMDAADQSYAADTSAIVQQAEEEDGEVLVEEEADVVNASSIADEELGSPIRRDTSSHGLTAAAEHHPTPYKSASVDLDDSIAVEEDTDVGEQTDVTATDFEEEADEEDDDINTAASVELPQSKLPFAAPTPKKFGGRVAATPARKAAAAAGGRVADDKATAATSGVDGPDREDNLKKLEERRMRREMGFASPPVQGILKRQRQQQASSVEDDAAARGRKGIRLLSPTTAAIVVPGSTPAKPATAGLAPPTPAAPPAAARSLSRGSTAANSDAESTKTAGTTRSAPARSTAVDARKASTRSTTPVGEPSTTTATVEPSVTSSAVSGGLKANNSASNVMAAIASTAKTSRIAAATSSKPSSKFMAAALGSAARIRTTRTETTAVKPAVRVSVMDSTSSTIFERKTGLAKKPALIK